MKIMGGNDLILVLSHTKQPIFDLEDIEQIFETFGDDYHIVDGQFVQTEENKTMKRFRKDIGVD